MCVVRRAGFSGPAVKALSIKLPKNKPAPHKWTHTAGTHEWGIKAFLAEPNQQNRILSHLKWLVEIVRCIIEMGRFFRVKYWYRWLVRREKWYGSGSSSVSHSNFISARFRKPNETTKTGAQQKTFAAKRNELHWVGAGPRGREKEAWHRHGYGNISTIAYQPISLA